MSSSDNHHQASHSKHATNGVETNEQPDNDNSLDKTFQKMEKLGIPADIFGNINPNWRTVMKFYYQAQNETNQQIEQQFDRAIEKIGRNCQTKYGSDKEKVEDCHEQAQLRIMNHFQKPKELSEILLCNFANKCLIRGNTVYFCKEEVMKERKVINSECFKRLQQIEEYL